MHISKRIQAIVDMVSPGYAICDVGCDHAYTSITLVENGKCPYAVASDVRPGPLAAARKNIDIAGLHGKIDVCLADGVPCGVHSMLPEGKKKALIITGMGGVLICGILERAGEKAAAFDEMVLSPQSDLDLVRQKLIEMGHTVDDEEMLVDEGKYYTVIRSVGNSNRHPARKHPKGSAGYTAELLYGPVLLAKRHPILWEYLKKKEKILSAILESLENAGRGPDDERYKEVKMKMEVLHEAQRYYECD